MSAQKTTISEIKWNQNSSVFSFSEAETSTVETILDKLKTKSTYGWGGMSVKLHKAIKSVLIKPLTVIINQMHRTGIFPDKLKMLELYLCTKRMMNPQIIIQYLCYLQFKKSLKSSFHITVYLLQNNILFSHHQYGFWEGHSTALEVVDWVIQDMDNGNTPFNVDLDI